MSASIHKPRILIVEDNPGDILLFRVAVSEAGIECDISEIHDGGAALDFVRKQTEELPDLVVLDLNLPKASGKEILAEIRARSAFNPIPVVIWTSSNASFDKAPLEALGVARYLLKPPELRDLAPLGVAIKEVLHVAGQSAK